MVKGRLCGSISPEKLSFKMIGVSEVVGQFSQRELVSSSLLNYPLKI